MDRLKLLNGTQAPGMYLGSTEPEQGDTTSIFYAIQFVSVINTGQFEPMYGISQELTVIPEPSSIWMAIAGLGTAIAYSTFRASKTSGVRCPAVK